MKKYFLLLVSLILAITLRVYQLDKVPVELFGDELDVGYQAYSILKTGQDLYGQKLPVFFHSLSEYRAPLFLYSAVPTIGLFGLNEWGVRIPAAFWGILGIGGLFFLAKHLFGEKIGLFAALILTISPWHIHFSRAGFEVTMLLAFLIWATFLFLKGVKNYLWFYFSAILFALTPYIYSTATLFMPLLVLMLVYLYRNELFKNLPKYLLAGLIFLVVLAPYGSNWLSGTAGARFNLISIFSEQSLKDQVQLAQQNENLPFNLEKVFHNKPVVYLQVFTLNYLRAFSPEFLFLNGDPNFRQSVHGMGQFYFYELIPLIAGIWFLLYKKEKEKWVVFGWLLISPIPAALTFDGGFHATRNFLMLAPLSILIGWGINDLLAKINQGSFRRYLALGLIILGIVNFTFFLHRYFEHYPKESWRAWNFGFKEPMQYLAAKEDQYSQIYINNSYEPSLIRFLFWTKYDPNKFHQQFSGDKVIQDITTNFDGFALEKKYYFGKFAGPFENNLKNGQLFLASSREDVTNPKILDNPNLRLVKTIRSPSGEVIFYLVTANPNEN
ncbi:MAG: glycosyltransferase family 39 protein [Candidatus Daviesbacteria bacterium]|nr:MAG: glycosyltransferase family 39 protein [Candidatus Daviesbacteria bacterium]